MLLNDLISHSKSVMPLFTDKFTTNISITSVTKAGDNVTVVATKHGVKVGENVIISGVMTDIAITNITNNLPSITSIVRESTIATVTTSATHYLQVGDKVQFSGAVETEYNVLASVQSILSETKFTYRVFNSPATPATGTITATTPNIAKATTTVDHDLTLGFVNDVNVTSAESSFNGVFTLLSVPSSLVFRFKMTGTASDNTGTLKTFFNSGFNGAVEVSVVTDANTFQYILDNDRLSSGSGSSMLLMKTPRIMGAATLDRAVDTYTKLKTNELMGFFVLDDMVTDDYRNTNSDAKNLQVVTEEFKIMLINNFTLYVFIPTHQDLSGRVSMDIGLNLVKPIFKVLTGFIPEIVFNNNQDTVVMPAGYSVAQYDAPFLIIAYDFQSTEFMFSKGCTENPTTDFMGNTGDILPNLNTRAFRKVNWKIENDQNVIIKDDEITIED